MPNGNPHVSSVFAFLYFRSLPCSSESLSANQLLVTGLFYQQRHLFVAYSDRGDRIRITVWRDRL